METLRGGFLLLFRWLVHYPIVHGTYRLRNWTRAPFLLNETLQDKPGILVSNYGNYFYDDMIGLMLGPVWPFSFVRDSVFRIPILKWFLKFFRALPIVRSGDTRYSADERRARNQAALERAASLLREGHWFSVFPEISSGHAGPLRTPLKPGAAHIGLAAEAGADWKLGLHIYVYGTNYENKFAGRSLLHIRWAAPIEVAKYRAAYEANPLAAEQALMKEIEEALHHAVLEAPIVEQLGFAHRLAFQRRQANFSGVQQALTEVLSGKSSPEDLLGIVCRRRNESALYQALGYLLWSFGCVVGWPFRVFGRLCASDPSEEMIYQFCLWVAVMIAGSIVNESMWAKTMIFDTWLAMATWLWAWRRGIIER